MVGINLHIYDMPRNIDIYIEHLKMTGRFQENGRSTTLLDPNLDEAVASALLRQLVNVRTVITCFIIILC